MPNGSQPHKESSDLNLNQSISSCNSALDLNEWLLIVPSFQTYAVPVYCHIT